MKKLGLLCVGILVCTTLTACGNSNGKSTNDSAKSNSVVKKSSSTSPSSSSSQSESINSSSASSESSTNSSASEINNAQDALNYLKQQKGDGNYTISHGTFGMSDHPYATIQDQDNDITYYVYQDGHIETSDEQ